MKRLRKVAEQPIHLFENRYLTKVDFYEVYEEDTGEVTNEGLKELTAEQEKLVRETWRALDPNGETRPTVQVIGQGRWYLKGGEDEWNWAGDRV